MEIFNSGKGGIKCERCSKIIKDTLIVKTSKKGRRLHYCSPTCLEKHNAKERDKNESTTT